MGLLSWDKEDNLWMRFCDSAVAHPERWSGRSLHWESLHPPPAVSSSAPRSAATLSATWSLLQAEQESKDTNVRWNRSAIGAAVPPSDQAIAHTAAMLAARSSYLGDAELAGCQLCLHLSHLLAAVAHSALQLLAAFDHCLHLWLHLADVKTSHRELFINQAAALLLLFH